MTAKRQTNRKGRTPEQKRAEMEQLHNTLTAAVEQLRDSETWTAYLRFARSFHRYSFSNLLLIWAQNPEATQVAGYRAWQAKGRQVRKGERGIRIYGTGTVKVAADNEDNGEEVENGRRRVFFPVSVFDIAQTEVMEGHEDVSELAHPLTGEDEGGILARVVDHLTASGAVVEISPLTTANGYTEPAPEGTGGPVRVVIADHLSPAHQAKTALHEAAHIALGHVEDLAEYVEHRGRFEVEAESVAYVLAGMLGIDSAAYSVGYVAGWAERAEADVIRDSATRVLAAVHDLADALHIDAEPEAEQAAA